MKAHVCVRARVHMLGGGDTQTFPIPAHDPYAYKCYCICLLHLSAIGASRPCFNEPEACRHSQR